MRDRTEDAADASESETEYRADAGQTDDRRTSGSRRGRSRRRFLAAAAASAGAAVAGCSGGGGGGADGGSDGGDGGDGSSGGTTAGSASGSGSTTTVTVGYQPFCTPYWSELINKHAELPSKYAPDGYEFEYQSALQGTIIGNRMIAGKNQIGYNGDMPTLIQLAQTEEPISMVGMSAWSWGNQCNIAVTPTSMDVSSVQDLDGRTIGVTKGGCAHRFILATMEREGIDATLRDQDVNTILSNISQGSYAAGLVWDPNATTAVVQNEKADYLFTGAKYKDPDVGTIDMTDAFMEEHPEAAKAFLKGELEAKEIMRNDPERAMDLIQADEDLANYERSTIEACAFKPIPLYPDTAKMRFATDMRKIEPVRKLLQETDSEFLVDQGTIDRIPPDDRYDFELLDEAQDELKEEVDWQVEDEEVPLP